MYVPTCVQGFVIVSRDGKDTHLLSALSTFLLMLRATPLRCLDASRSSSSKSDTPQNTVTHIASSNRGNLFKEWERIVDESSDSFNVRFSVCNVAGVDLGCDLL